ncbi:hypothetical protein OF83DRAFT_1128298 [Amylostereum chailletii]|nr:hypothetical protein OF83DRAFT_1128298 [Amylostereum chailletii]
MAYSLPSLYPSESVFDNRGLTRTSCFPVFPSCSRLRTSSPHNDRRLVVVIKHSPFPHQPSIASARCMASSTHIPRLPQDVYRRIIYSDLTINCDPYHLGHFTLLCLSKAWKYEVECALYERVKIPDNNLLLFARTLAARPDLASRVRTLEFITAGRHPRRPGERELVRRMFKMLVNLKDLAFRCREAGIGGPENDLIYQAEDEWILADVPFKLDRLVCTFGWGERLFHLLKTQPSLRQFESSDDSVWTSEWLQASGPRASEDVLENCRCMAIVPYMTATFARLPRLTHVRLKLSMRSPVDEAYGAAEVGRFGEDLRVAMIDRFLVPEADGEYLAPAQIVKKFAEKTPNVTVLGMVDAASWSPRDNKEVLQVLVSFFPKLKAFIWGPNSRHYSLHESDDWSSTEFDGFSTDSDDESTERDKVEKYARAMMEAIPSMEYFFVVGQRRSGTGSYKRELGEDGRVRVGRRGILLTQATDFCYIDPEAPYDALADSLLNGRRFDLT